MEMRGVWVPVVTPFSGSSVDEEALAGLVASLIGKGVSGIISGATTGESTVLSDDERLRVASSAKKAAKGRVPVFAAAGGPDTAKTIAQIGSLRETGVDGILSVCPYYVRPDQRGIIAHFEAVASSTPLPVVLYNIPYRTGMNMTNETIRKLADIPNIIGLKDSSGDLRQSMDLLLNPPPDFSILTGEDAFFYSMLALGAHGGILASAHWETEAFVRVWLSAQRNDFAQAREAWKRLAPAIPLFFQEPNPAPIKHYLFHLGHIPSGAVRLPLVTPSPGLMQRLEALTRRPPA
jgi:4-hydroxy-tetrahydrodipicolinate synthase